MDSSFFMDIVYEWEDIIAKKLSIKIVKDNNIRIKRWLYYIPGCIRLLFPCGFYLKYDLDTWCSVGLNEKFVIPIIIDFYVPEKELKDFYSRYNNHKVVIITSKEAYDFLKKHDCPFKIAHWPLSIPDIYKITPSTRFKKKYDILLLGRQNKVLQSFLQTYLKAHPNLNYVSNVWKDGKWYYYSSSGDDIGFVDSREDYIRLMRCTKVMFYSTPGKDNNGSHHNGYNQVTPRFLECLACGCHIIMRYDLNPDVEYYELPKHWKSVDSYDEFVYQLEYALSHEVDMKMYSDYLKNHYTSTRTEELRLLLKNI